MNFFKNMIKSLDIQYEAEQICNQGLLESKKTEDILLEVAIYLDGKVSDEDKNDILEKALGYIKSRQ